MTTPPNHALPRFEVAGSHGEGFTKGKGLVNNQAEAAGVDEPTVPRPSPSNKYLYETVVSVNCSRVYDLFWCLGTDRTGQDLALRPLR
jgi:hypothetical protein